MRIEISDEIVKKMKQLNECCDFGKEELKEYLSEVIEELLEDYIADNSDLNFNEGDDEE